VPRHWNSQLHLGHWSLLSVLKAPLNSYKRRDFVVFQKNAFRNAEVRRYKVFNELYMLFLGVSMGSLSYTAPLELVCFSMCSCNWAFFVGRGGHWSSLRGSLLGFYLLVTKEISKSEKPVQRVPREFQNFFHALVLYKAFIFGNVKFFISKWLKSYLSKKWSSECYCLKYSFCVDFVSGKSFNAMLRTTRWKNEFKF